MFAVFADTAKSVVRLFLFAVHCITSAWILRMQPHKCCKIVIVGCALHNFCLVLQMQPQKCCKIVIVGCALHNFCLDSWVVLTLSILMTILEIVEMS